MIAWSDHVGAEEVVELQQGEKEDSDKGAKQVVFFAHFVLVTNKVESIEKVIAQILLPSLSQAP